MLRISGSAKRLCNGITRRDLLQIGGISALGLGSGANLAGETSELYNGRAKACIFVFLFGSPPQHETFDPKPQAAAEIQGEMKAIDTVVPGLQICEGLPQIAGIADRLTVVRSMTHEYPIHCCAYSSVFAGGGMARGRVVGETDAIGGDVVDMPISPNDMQATAYHLLGYDESTTMPDQQGRPHPIAGSGRIRNELLG